VNEKASPPTTPRYHHYLLASTFSKSVFMYLIVILLFPHVIASDFLLKNMLVLSCTLIRYLLLNSEDLLQSLIF
jgi:hypothetical protein